MSSSKGRSIFLSSWNDDKDDDLAYCADTSYSASSSSGDEDNHTDDDDDDATVKMSNYSSIEASASVKGRLVGSFAYPLLEEQATSDLARHHLYLTAMAYADCHEMAAAQTEQQHSLKVKEEMKSPRPEIIPPLYHRPFPPDSYNIFHQKFVRRDDYEAHYLLLTDRTDIHRHSLFEDDMHDFMYAIYTCSQLNTITLVIGARFHIKRLGHATIPYVLEAEHATNNNNEKPLLLEMDEYWSNMLQGGVVDRILVDLSILTEDSNQISICGLGPGSSTLATILSMICASQFPDNSVFAFVYHDTAAPAVTYKAAQVVTRLQNLHHYNFITTPSDRANQNKCLGTTIVLGPTDTETDDNNMLEAYWRLLQDWNMDTPIQELSVTERPLKKSRFSQSYRLLLLLLASCAAGLIMPLYIGRDYLLRSLAAPVHYHMVRRRISRPKQEQGTDSNMPCWTRQKLVSWDEQNGSKPLLLTPSPRATPTLLEQQIVSDGVPSPVISLLPVPLSFQVPSIAQNDVIPILHHADYGNSLIPVPWYTHVPTFATTTNQLSHNVPSPVLSLRPVPLSTHVPSVDSSHVIPSLHAVKNSQIPVPWYTHVPSVDVLTTTKSPNFIPNVWSEEHLQQPETFTNIDKMIPAPVQEDSHMAFPVPLHNHVPEAIKSQQPQEDSHMAIPVPLHNHVPEYTVLNSQMSQRMPQPEDSHVAIPVPLHNYVPGTFVSWLTQKTPQEDSHVSIPVPLHNHVPGSTPLKTPLLVRESPKTIQAAPSEEDVSSRNNVESPIPNVRSEEHSESAHEVIPATPGISQMNKRTPQEDNRMVIPVPLHNHVPGCTPIKNPLLVVRESTKPVQAAPLKEFVSSSNKDNIRLPSTSYDTSSNLTSQQGPHKSVPLHNHIPAMSTQLHEICSDKPMIPAQAYIFTPEIPIFHEQEVSLTTNDEATAEDNSYDLFLKRHKERSKPTTVISPITRAFAPRRALPLHERDAIPSTSNNDEIVWKWRVTDWYHRSVKNEEVIHQETLERLPNIVSKYFLEQE